jgi:hypothetical protein
VSPTNVPPNKLKGDANCDGRVNSIDAFIVLTFVARKDPPPPCLKEADVNSNGVINAVDALLILHIEAGLL